jgi:hypothetical protein
MGLTNEDYLKRWDESAPELVDSWSEDQKEAARNRPTKQQDIDTYDREMMGEFNDAALVAAIEEYSQRVSDAAPTAQTDEELCRLQEQNENKAKEYQWLTPQEYADAGDRVGKVKGVATFITQLQKAGLNCWYRRHPHPDKLTLVVVNELSKEAEVGCWVQFGFMPELSVFRFDDHGIPTTEKYRGWRTCLLQIILKGFITQEKAEEIFGKPPTTKAFHRYNRTLQAWRNQGRRLAK